MHIQSGHWQPVSLKYRTVFYSFLCFIIFIGAAHWPHEVSFLDKLLQAKIQTIFTSFLFSRLKSQMKAFLRRCTKKTIFTFGSHKYFKHRRHDLFLGIKHNRRSKSPKLTYPGQISVQFVLLPNNNTEEKARITSRAKQNRVRQDKRDKG